ncbi:MAG: 7TM-DISM domain-containing protein [Oscillospiraceae bacterium]|nr:7TM-DISM domain-containing protein [Oscillospiraceae bacterium]
MPYVVHVESSGGLWDMTEFNFSGESAGLTGDVEFVPYELLAPAAFEASENKILGVIPSDVNSLTTRIRLLVPEGVYTFSGPPNNSAISTYVNGELLSKMDWTSDTLDAAEKGDSVLLFTAQPIDGVIEVVSQTENHIYRGGSDHIDWRVSTESTAGNFILSCAASNIFIMGFMFILFFVHLFMFLMIPNSKVNIWLALLCLTWALRAGCTGIKIMQALFPTLSWMLISRVESIIFPVTISLLAIIYHTLFPNALHDIFRLASFCTAGIFSAFYIFGDAQFISQTSLLIKILCAISVLYIFVRLVMKVRRPNSEQLVMMLGSFVVFIGFVMDILYYENSYMALIPGAVAEFAIIALSMFQIIALNFSVIREAMTVKEEAERRVELENKAVEKVKQLRKDLREITSGETRDPLLVLSGYAELVSMEIEYMVEDAQTVADLDKISVETHKLLRMIERVRKMAAE